MSRLMKFRIWCRSTKHFTDSAHLSASGGQLLWLHTGNKVSISNLDEEEYIVHQFSGLQDKNKKDVYEGDFIRLSVRNKPDFKSESCWEVQYLNDLATFGLIYGNCFQTFEDILKDDDVNWEMEVIGNVCQNPDLAAKKK